MAKESDRVGIVTVELWDKDTYDDDLIGSGQFKVQDAVNKKKIYVRLKYKNKEAGSVNLELRIK